MNTGTKTQIWQLSAMEIAKAIKQKEVSCEETIISHFERIETVNAKINAITVVLQDSALYAAKNCDKLLASGKTPPPLMGVPITVKENIDCKGSATSFGVNVLKQALPQTDAPHIKNLKNAGAIVLGRTNMPDLGLRLHTDNDLYGATLNPWDTSRTPGGSSGGDAAAVATGMTPIGLGNDYGGSLRQPACFCGVTTIRPSIGRVPDYMSLLPAEPAISMQLFMVQGPIARQVSDLLPVLQSMGQFDPRDPDWSPTPFIKKEISHKIRVAKCIRFKGTDLDPAVIDGINKAGDTLVDAGYIVEEIAPPKLNELWKLWIELTSSELRAFTLPSVKPIISQGALKFLTNWVDLHPDCGYSGYMAGLAMRKAIAREWSLFQQKYPLVLGPVVGTQPFGVDTDINSMDEFQQILEGYPLTMGANVLGLPAVALPVGMANNLPQGVQLVGPRYHECLCLDAAQAIEDRLGTISPVNIK
jgi:amidase